MEPRGIRNNNPLNIIRNGIKWQGMADEQTDTQFVRFRTMAWGIRAACLLSRTYIQKHHVRLLRDFIYRWCPDSTAKAYVEVVCQRTTFAPTYVVDWKKKHHLLMILQAMAFVETGRQIPYMEFENGYALAFSNKLLDEMTAAEGNSQASASS